MLGRLGGCNCIAMAEATFVKVLKGWEAVCHGGCGLSSVRLIR
jgi:hypothetical protein